MKKLLFPLMALVLALGLTLPMPTPAAADDTGSISGYVYESDGTTTIPGATVSASNFTSTAPPVLQVTTDTSGHYILSGLAAGDYRLAAVAAAHDRRYYPNTIYRAQGQAVTVTAGQEMSGKNFTLGPGGTISGNVARQSDGQPLSQVSVGASVPGVAGPGITGALTDASGNYIIDGVPYGTYIVQAPANGAGSGDDSYIPERWREKSMSAYDPVTVSAGTNPTGKNFTLEPGGTISGHVYLQGSTTPIASVAVTVFDYSSLTTSVWITRTTVITNTSGYFKTLGVPAGQYGVRAGDTVGTYAYEWYNNTPFRNDAAPVTVTLANDTPNIDFTLEPGGSISGTVIADAGGAIANCPVNVSDYATNKWVNGLRSATDGTYTISNLPVGTYRVSALPANNSLPYINEYYNNAYDFNLAQSVTVTAGQITPSINFSLASGGSISGHVYQQGTTTPISQVTVTVIDYNTLTGAWITRGTATTDAQGYYKAAGLPAGQYGVRAGDQAGTYAYEWYNNTPFKDNSTPVTVTVPDETTNIDFTLEPGGAISGMVIADAGGIAIANCPVNVSDYATNKWVNGLRTVADGTYTIRNLPVGTYRVSALPGNNNLPYANEYYNDTYDYSAAQSVPVTAGQSTQNINFSLAPGGSISGTVRNADGSQALANVSVECKRTTDGSYDFNTRSDSLGNYIISGIPYANYIVRSPSSGRWGSGDDGYLTEYYNNQTSEGSANAVTVGAGTNPTGINFSLALPAPGGTISGHVYDNASGNPISGATVSISNVSLGPPVATVQTGTDGSYTVSGLAAGSYIVSASATGHAIKFWNNKPNRPLADQVAITAAVGAANIDLRLEAGGPLSGKVTDQATGNPVANISVYIKSIADPTLSWRPTTNSTGDYSLNLLYGSYKVWAPGGTGSADALYNMKYYNNKPDETSADPVSISDVSGAPGINFSLTAVSSGGTISGHVSDNVTGLPISNASVNVYLVAGQPPVKTATTGADGAYIVSGLADGSYLVSANAQGYSMGVWQNTLFMRSATPVVVTSSAGATGIDFKLLPGGPISGTVTSASIVVPNMFLYIVNVNDANIWWLPRTDSNGVFQMNVPNGSYKVYAPWENDTAASQYVRQYYNNKPDASSADPVIISNALGATGINFNLLKTTATALVSSLNPSDFGQPVSFNATVTSTGAIPTGTVQFKIDGLDFGTPVTLSGGNAISGATSTLTGGNHAVTAVYSGDASFNGSTSSPLTQTVNKVAATVTLGNLNQTYDGTAKSATATTVPPGLAVTFTYNGLATPPTNAGSYNVAATVTNPNYTGSASGTMVIAIANQTITFGALANKTYGNADFPVSATASSGLVVNFTASGNCTISGNTAHIAGIGSCTITAHQVGNGNYNAAPDVFQTFTVAPAPLTVTANNASKVYGAPLPAFTATATGLVNGDTMASLGTLQFSTTATPTSAVGTYPITPAGLTSANYVYTYINGTLTISKASTTIIVSSSKNPSTSGDAVTFKATLSIVLPGAGSPKGTVDFKDGTDTIATKVALNGNIATYTTTSLSAGSHSITAVYSGDGSFNGCTSAAITQTVIGARDIKSGTIAKLNAARTGDKDIDRTIDDAIKHINNSLDAGLWADGSHLVFQPRTDWLHELSDKFDKNGRTVEDDDMDDDARVATQSITGFKDGITVLHEEQNAVSALQKYVEQFTREIPRLEKSIADNGAKGKDVTKDKADLANMKKTLPVFQAVINDLVHADSILARVLIADAKNTPVSDSKLAKIVAHEIAQAEEDLARANEAVNKGQPEMAITRYSHAWMHAQLAMKFATMDVPKLPDIGQDKDNNKR